MVDFIKNKSDNKNLYTRLNHSGSSSDVSKGAIKPKLSKSSRELKRTNKINKKICFFSKENILEILSNVFIYQ